jgi:HSP90 family molecular chaperone
MVNGELCMKRHHGRLWLVGYTSTKSLKEKITLAKYVARMKEGQTHIYYVTSAVEELIVPFIRNDVEVLFIVGTEASTLLTNIDTHLFLSLKSVEEYVG